MWLVGCGGGSEPTSTGSGSATAGSSAGSGVGSAQKPAAADAGVTATDAAARPPLSPKIHEARCDEACLFLVDTPLDKLNDAFKAACPGKQAPEINLQSCAKLDYLRNCIYAAHGLVYTKKAWKSAFAKKPWYTPDPAVSAKTILDDLERANVHALRDSGKACKKGFDIGTDYARIKAWFDVWPKRPPLPSVLFSGDSPVDEVAIDAKTFATKLQAALGKGKISLGGKVNALNLGDDLHYTGADYPSDDMPTAMVTAIHAPDEKVLRGIRVAFPDAKPASDGSLTGSHVFFIYDNKDKLRGLEIRPFAYEKCNPNTDDC
jgi:hypothetical protein